MLASPFQTLKYLRIVLVFRRTESMFHLVGKRLIIGNNGTQALSGEIKFFTVKHVSNKSWVYAVADSSHVKVGKVNQKGEELWSAFYDCRCIQPFAMINRIPPESHVVDISMNDKTVCCFGASDLGLYVLVLDLLDGEFIGHITSLR